MTSHTWLRPIRTIRDDTGDASREFVRAAPHPRLTGLAVGYTGYRERGGRRTQMREVPGGILPLIVNFGPPFRLADAGTADRWSSFGSFGGGLSDVFTLVESCGTAHCVQVDFTPLGARRFFGLPLAELTNRVVTIEDLFGRNGGLLADRLHEISNWAGRFDLLEDIILRRIDAQSEPAPDLVWILRRLEESGGRTQIDALAAEIGCSRKHLSVRFHEQFGLAPKTLAGVLRFSRIAAALDDAVPPALADLAVEAGYYDQSHLNREFRRFAGITPTEYMSRRMPEGGGVIDR